MQNETKTWAAAAPANILSKAFERAQVPLLSLAADDSFTVCGASDGFLGIAGLFRENLVGRPLFGLLERCPSTADAASLAQLQAMLRTVLATRRTGDADGIKIGSTRDAPGQHPLWRAITTPVVSSAGSLEGLVVAFEGSAESAGGSVGQDRMTRIENDIFDVRNIERNREASAVLDGLQASRLRILLVDDNVDALEALAMLLEFDGHEVRTAETAAMALQVTSSWHPDVGLLDIGLRGMDGYELARRLRSEPAMSKLRLVAVTGSGHSEDRRMALAAGFDEHLVKPVQWEVLLQVVYTAGGPALEAT